jgi:hypothetical protein
MMLVPRLGSEAEILTQVEPLRELAYTAMPKERRGPMASSIKKAVAEGPEGFIDVTINFMDDGGIRILPDSP